MEKSDPVLYGLDQSVFLRRSTKIFLVLFESALLDGGVTCLGRLRGRAKSPQSLGKTRPKSELSLVIPKGGTRGTGKSPRKVGVGALCHEMVLPTHTLCFCYSPFSSFFQTKADGVNISLSFSRQTIVSKA